MKKINILLLTIIGTFIIIISGCDKTKTYPLITPPGEAHFNTTGGTFYVTNTNPSTFKIPIGVTNIANVDRKVTVSVSSPTNAASGAQYTLPSNTVTIPAGKAVDSLSVNGIFAGYPTGRRDTLIFLISGGDVDTGSGSFNTKYILVLQKYCAVVASDLTGNYTNTKDYDKTTSGTASAAKYTAVISTWTPINATSATITIKNLASTSDIGFGPFGATEPAVTGLTATVDFSNPANFTVTLPSQPYVNTDLYGYGKATISGSGTFSSCDQSFVITSIVKVSVGSFTAVATKLLR